MVPAAEPDSHTNHVNAENPAGPRIGDAWEIKPDASVRENLVSLQRVFAQAGIDQAAADASALLEHVSGLSRAEVQHYMVMGHAMTDVLTWEQHDELKTLVHRRLTREPLQHIVGHAAFRYLTLEVGQGVFVPRPETEIVAQQAIDEAQHLISTGIQAPLIIDLCTGSGAIALALATEIPTATVYAVELDEDAHRWAQRNNRRHGDPVHLYRGDARTALAHLAGRADIVVSNPPYIPPDAVPRDPEVARWDPQVALYGLGVDGLEVPRGITAHAAKLLRPSGLYIMEHAESQAHTARAMVDSTRLFQPAHTQPDFTGRPRMVVARRHPPEHVEG
ncbi:peptide chain release factor N(5)-glutamine methyltransferase [Jonesia quinghaiensis]|uniref:peptide chain release factor N(5)-glutamine methyltransferase n=1 Tax=Jonesia quinghaiensis TaxID=262806 RepID=UPI00041AF24C|nr:peptide chain release factor N(5)-glutamine methyltransferase [Jonesia quinghaiensis]